MDGGSRPEDGSSINRKRRDAEAQSCWGRVLCGICVNLRLQTA